MVVIAKFHHYIKSGLSQIFAIFRKLNLKCAGKKLDLGPRNLAWIVYMVGGVDGRKGRVGSKRLTHPSIYLYLEFSEVLSCLMGIIVVYIVCD